NSIIKEKKKEMHLNSEGALVFVVILYIMVVEDASGRRHRNNIYGICSKSRETVREVSHCPSTPEERRKRAEVMRCGSVVQSCTRPHRFVYHCLPNSFWNKTIEVCAPKQQIVRHKCAEYNEKGTRVQTNFEHSCLEAGISCPVYYSSDEAYKYQSCYKLESNYHTTNAATNNKETTHPCATK
ncbi:uncharacterized protein LOC134245088, partial [Saccostrea cucullata]|uniref:uncharacterized protein LOC134245088 n=1 Tax=Saccostrea cuccullata TaxID=36930 RepID=UPI002ED44F97